MCFQQPSTLRIGQCLRRKDGGGIWRWPVGLLSAYCAILKGASEVYVVDYVEERLAKAEELEQPPLTSQEAIQSNRFSNCGKRTVAFEEGLRPGEEKMQGVDCAIDAVGYQARSDSNPKDENATQVLENCLKVVNATGSIGLIGVYMAPDPGGKDKDSKQGIYPFPIAEFFDEGHHYGKWPGTSEKIQRVSA